MGNIRVEDEEFFFLVILICIKIWVFRWCDCVWLCLIIGVVFISYGFYCMLYFWVYFWGFCIMFVYVFCFGDCRMEVKSFNLS